VSDRYVNIALNIPVHKLFTYRVPEYINDVQPGMRAIVPFGSKTLTGMIVEFVKPDDTTKIKSLKTILDRSPVLDDKMIEFSKWMSEYYVAAPGEIYFLGIPKNINIKSIEYYSLSDNYKDNINKTKSKNESIFLITSIFETNDNDYLTLKQIEHRAEKLDLKRVIDEMLHSGILIKEKYYSEPTKEKFIKIISRNFKSNELENIIKENKIRSKKKIDALKILSETDKIELKYLFERSGLNYMGLYELFEKDLICIEQKRKHREPQDIYTERSKTIILNDYQANAIKEITDSIVKNKFETFLLYGVTGSGKTEVYIRSIRKVLEEGKQAIVLVPEISLTPQLIHRFRNAFGNTIGVIHSKLSEGERADTFDRIKSSDYKIIIGARSALFSPVKNLGIIVVDEEHDSSYKQDNSPRYQARDAAIVRAKISNVPVVLGSATPSFESYYNAKKGKYKLILLPERATKINMPEIKIFDIKYRNYLDFQKQKDYAYLFENYKSNVISKEFIIEIEERLLKNESVIVLQNRRGFHSYIECSNCGEVATCKRCNVALTYHKTIDLLKCHFCGYTRREYKKCDKCGSEKLLNKGVGTEKVEEELKKIFPKAIIKRLDSDSMISKKKYAQTIQDFYDKKINILVGTQIISKGLDFPDVTLVGVINADIGLLTPDFRATEKTFQILTQVSGRSGRSDKKGEVIIHTSHPDYAVFDDVSKYDYEKFYERELRFRKLFNYPPLSRMILIELRGREQNLVEGKSKELFNILTELNKEKRLEILPPNPPLISKLKDLYRFHLLIKSLKDKDLSGKYISSVLHFVKEYTEKNFPSGIRVIIDVDVNSLY